MKKEKAAPKKRLQQVQRAKERESVKYRQGVIWREISRKAITSFA